MLSNELSVIESTYTKYYIDLSHVDRSEAEDKFSLNDEIHNRRIVSFDAAVIDVYFDQPVFLNGTIPMEKIHHFMDLRHHHRQVLYGLTELECGNITIDSYPDDGLDFDHGFTNANEMHPMLFPLPCSSFSRVRWLNVLCDELWETSYRFGFPDNRISYAVLLNVSSSHEQGDREPVLFEEAILDPDLLDSCKLRFFGDNRTRWETAKYIAAFSGSPYAGDILLEESEDAVSHLHIVEGNGAASSSSFLSLGAGAGGIPFLSMLMPPILDAIFPHAMPFIASHISVVMQSMVMPNVAGYVAGSRSPGAQTVDLSGFGAGVLPVPPIGGAVATMLLEQQIYFAEERGETVTLNRSREFAENLDDFRMQQVVKKGKGGMDGKVTKALTSALISILTPELTISLTERLVADLVKRLYIDLFMSLKDHLKETIGADIPRIVVPALNEILGHSIPILLERSTVPRLLIALSNEIVGGVSRGLTHSVVPSLSLALKYPEGGIEADEMLYYAHYYAAYYSDWVNVRNRIHLHSN